jgi:hypothetical protein
MVGPSGDPQVSSKSTFPVPSAPIMSLIAGFGDETPILVGDTTMVMAPTNGTLWLGANDDGHGDNAGSITIRITVAN